MAWFLFLIAPLTRSLETTWVWGSPLTAEQIEYLSVFDTYDSSYIKLDLARTVLTIESVKKGPNWDSAQPFCKQLLPATVFEFLNTNQLEVGVNITRIEVFNIATPHMAGCRCYVLGFNLINMRIVKSESDIGAFCNLRKLNVYATQTANVNTYTEPSFSPLVHQLMTEAHRYSLDL
jgi:hypothetical protein